MLPPPPQYEEDSKETESKKVSLLLSSLMKPKLPLKLHSLIVHAAFAAVIEVKTEPDKQVSC